MQTVAVVILGLELLLAQPATGKAPEQDLAHLREVLEDRQDARGQSQGLRRVVAGALTELTGQTHGQDEARWKAWWSRHKDLTTEQWLEMRLAFQSTRANRLEGELLRARAQVLRLHQQVYLRLPVA